MPLENERDTVVLISEPDTDFSRDLPGLFVAAVQGANGDESATPTNILQIGYLRGLDGQVTEKTRSKTQPPPFCLLFSSSSPGERSAHPISRSRRTFSCQLTIALGPLAAAAMHCAPTIAICARARWSLSAVLVPRRRRKHMIRWFRGASPDGSTQRRISPTAMSSRNKPASSFRRSPKARMRKPERIEDPQGWFNQLAPQGADAAAPPVLLHEMRRPAPQRDFPDLYQSSLRRFSRRIVGTPRRRCQSINPQSF